MKVRSSNLVDHTVKAFVSDDNFVLPLTDYKPVVESIGADAAQPLPPHARWQDVTGECRPMLHSVILGHWGSTDGKTGYLSHTGIILPPDTKDNDEYRLRKVQAPNHGSGMSSYFIVERKVPE